MRISGLFHPGIIMLLLVTAPLVCPAALPDSLTGLHAFDIPNDRGNAIGISWQVHPGEGPEREYIIYRSDSPEGVFEEILRFPSHEYLKSDAPQFFGYTPRLALEHFVPVEVEFVNGEQVPHYYRVALTDGVDQVFFRETVTATAFPNWFAWNKLNNLALMLFTCGMVLFFIQWAKRNPNLFIRKLAGLEAVDEAIGRATEMGKPIIYSTGFHDMDYVSTIASVNILAHVARKVADYDSRLIVPCKWAIAMTVCQEVVKEAYANAGRPDAYNPHDIYYVAGEQFSWTAAVDGIIVRERPAANFFLGTFAAEALILAETGATTGAIQISGTDSAYQIPFFVVACDYCLIGEELYAASAYLSREPRLLGTLKGQDAGKMLLITGLIIGNILLQLHQFFPYSIFMWVKHFFIPL